PSVIEPTRDLWPEIRGRLEPRRPRRRRPRPALAAAAGLVLGLAVGVIGGRAFDILDRPAGSAPAIVPVAASLSEDPHQMIDTLEAEVLRTKEQLWLSALSRSSQALAVGADGSSSTGNLDARRRVIEDNLEIIDRALDDIRAALVQDPSNPRLQRALMATHRRSLELLRTLSNEA
ncbi:MAG: hypothetical protein AAGN46_18735, partial [Acidobacteriota bacterium]